MNIPKNINLFGEKITIKKASLSGIMGCYHSTSKTILIDKTLNGSELTSTIVHELFHALSDRVSLRQAISLELEEIIADTVAKMIDEHFVIKFKKKK